MPSSCPATSFGEQVGERQRGDAPLGQRVDAREAALEVVVAQAGAEVVGALDGVHDRDVARGPRLVELGDGGDHPDALGVVDLVLHPLALRDQAGPRVLVQQHAAALEEDRHDAQRLAPHVLRLGDVERRPQHLHAALAEHLEVAEGGERVEARAAPPVMLEVATPEPRVQRGCAWTSVRPGNALTRRTLARHSASVECLEEEVPPRAPGTGVDPTRQQALPGSAWRRSVPPCAACWSWLPQRLLALPTAAHAFGESAITAPADPSRIVVTDGSPAVLVEGTVTAPVVGDKVDIVCLTGSSALGIPATEVDAETGSFSVSVAAFSLFRGVCRMHAIPSGADMTTLDLSKYTGPLVTADIDREYRTPPADASGNVVNDFLVAHAQPRGSVEPVLARRLRPVRSAPVLRRHDVEQRERLQGQRLVLPRGGRPQPLLPADRRPRRRDLDRRLRHRRRPRRGRDEGVDADRRAAHERTRRPATPART